MKPLPLLSFSSTLTIPEARPFIKNETYRGRTGWQKIFFENR
jgi:hypothetical protein